MGEAVSNRFLCQGHSGAHFNRPQSPFTLDAYLLVIAIALGLQIIPINLLIIVVFTSLLLSTHTCQEAASQGAGIQNTTFSIYNVTKQSGRAAATREYLAFMWDKGLKGFITCQ